MKKMMKELNWIKKYNIGKKIWGNIIKCIENNIKK
jgi:hypothetical protein